MCFGKRPEPRPKKAGGGQKGGVSDGSHDLQNYDPIQYESNPAELRSRPVTHVHFIAQTILRTGGNHWGIYLQNSPNKSVRLNMDPSDLLGAKAPNHGFRGQLKIRGRNYAATENQEMMVTISARPGHSVGEFIDMIMNEGNHLYDFTTVGRGCTGWILDQFNLFQQHALIARGYNLEEVLAQEWVDAHATKRMGVTRGTYMRDTTYGGWAGRGALRPRR